jgi:signal transduction histidine kinase
LKRLAVALLAWALAPSAVVAQEESHERVLLVYSFGSDFAPWDDFALGLRRELTRLSPRPVEFFEASLETARFAGTSTEAPLANYLDALFRESGIDLVVTIGAPAARFCVTYRERLFPSTPLLVAGVDERVLSMMPPRAKQAVISVALDLPGAIENILEVLPDTTDVIVIMGSSPLEKLWVEELRRAVQPFRNRVRFTWFDDLSVGEMEKRVSVLPPHTAIFFGQLSVDAAGVPQEHNEALARLYEVSTAPIFGLFDNELGRGIVGGPLVAISDASRDAATAALRLLNGEPAASIRTPPLIAGAPVYDFRELRRWSISETRLPPGSTVLFLPPSLWERYKVPLIAGTTVVGLETMLIAALLLQRARRKQAEQEALGLSRRLLTAHEDERRRLGRELHDDITQRLARLAIDAGQMEARLLTISGESPSSSTSDGLVELSEDVHALSYQLHPSLIEDLGLHEALQAECERFSRTEGIAVDFAGTERPDELERDESLCLFRIGQEALRNVSRHAHASRVMVSLEHDHGGMRLVVKDDGVGFEPAGRSNGASLGHASMRERIHLVGGKLQIDSGRDRGTTVTAWAPSRNGSA